MTSLDFTDWGEGYTERPTITLSGGDGSGATATCLYGDDEVLDKTIAKPIETYHSVGFDVTFITPIDNRDGHGFAIPFDLASCGDVTVRGVHTIGLSGSAPYGGALGSVSSGDLANAYAVLSQRPKIGKGIRIIDPIAEEVNITTGSEAFMVKGAGESKANGDFEPGTRVFNQRQLVWDVEITNPQIFFSAEADPTKQRGISLS